MFKWFCGLCKWIIGIVIYLFLLPPYSHTISILYFWRHYIVKFSSSLSKGEGHLMGLSVCVCVCVFHVFSRTRQHPWTEVIVGAHFCNSVNQGHCWNTQNHVNRCSCWNTLLQCKFGTLLAHCCSSNLWLHCSNDLRYHCSFWFPWLPCLYQHQWHNLRDFCALQSCFQMLLLTVYITQETVAAKHSLLPYRI